MPAIKRVQRRELREWRCVCQCVRVRVRVRVRVGGGRLT